MFYRADLYHSSRMLHFLQVEGNTLYQQQIRGCLVAVLMLLWGSGMEPTISTWHASVGYLKGAI